MEGLGDFPLDAVINNAGYFKEERESILDGTMDFSDQVKTIDRVAHVCVRGGGVFLA